MPKVPFPVVYADVKFVCQKSHLMVLFFWGPFSRSIWHLNVKSEFEGLSGIERQKQI